MNIATTNLPKGVPHDITEEQWNTWNNETIEKLDDPNGLYLFMLVTTEMRTRAINVGIACCWLREKWREHGYDESAIWDKQNDWGRKAFFIPGSPWRLARKEYKKMT